MYSYDSRIRYSEVDATGNLKIEALLDYFQDCSTFHSEDLGLGVSHLKEQHMVWMITSWQIIVERYPRFGETVIVGTAPYFFKGFLGYRNFLMTDTQGNRLAYANTIWSLINTDSGKPAKPTEEMTEKYILEPRLEMDYAPRKIVIPEESGKGEPVQIRPNHLDTNHHVNNGQYVRIAIDSLLKDFRIRQLRAEYKKQAYLNDILVPYISCTQDGKYVVVLKNAEEEACCIVELQEERE